jgi:hypothetical protein
MAYNLPPPWDPGYALPDNVRDEGLQRHAFVTKQMPRGTYDDVVVGTGGYVVPQYVLDERTGRGTFTTKWMPRGTYNGPKVPYWLNQRPTSVQRHVAKGVRQVTFSGDERYEQAGFDMAQRIMAQVASLPPSSRKSAMRRILDRIDPTLWDRVAAQARQYVAQGMSASQALLRGLAAGLASSSAPSSAALGADMPFIQAAPRTATAPSSSSAVCQNPLPGFTWDATMNAWRRPKVGETPQPYPGTLTGPACTPVARTGAGTVVVTDTKTGATTGGVIKPRAPMPTKFLAVGPDTFMVPVDSAEKFQVTVHDPKQLPAQWAQWIAGAWAQGTSSNNFFGQNEKLPKDMSDMKGWFDRLGLDMSAKYNLARVGGTQACFAFTHPVDGKDWGLYCTLRRLQGVPVLSMYVKPKPKNWFMRLVAKIVNTISDAIHWVGDEICDLITTPGAAQGAAAAGGPAGAAAAVGATMIAAKKCGSKPVDVPVIPQVSMMPVVLGGAALLGIFLWTRHRRSTP